MSVDPLNAPRVQRKIPKPFQRKSIAVSPPPQVKREWHDVPVELVRPGDTVAGYGLVHSGELYNVPEFGQVPFQRSAYVFLTMGEPSRTQKFRLGDTVLAFVPALARD